MSARALTREGRPAGARAPGGPGRPPDPGKARDRAMVLPLVGFALVLPPLGSIFQLDLKVAGVPFALVYLFAVWAGLILCGWLLSRQLGPVQADAAAAQGSEGQRPESRRPETPPAEPAGGSGA